MIYNDRVTLIFEKRPEDELLDKVEKKQSFPIPCMRNAMSNYEMMGLFGKYDFDAFKLHLQGVHKGFSEVIYKGQKMKIKGKRYHHNSTVIYL
nr:MAG TPA: head closure knob [Caudoviricetes sp.]